jgi:hypothetical protein
VYQNYLALRNTADVTGGKRIAVFLKSISGVIAINLLAVFYDIHGKERDAMLLFCPGHHTKHNTSTSYNTSYNYDLINYDFKWF